MKQFFSVIKDHRTKCKTQGKYGKRKGRDKIMFNEQKKGKKGKKQVNNEIKWT